jgi:hypothetical protein
MVQLQFIMLVVEEDHTYMVVLMGQRHLLVVKVVVVMQLNLVNVLKMVKPIKVAVVEADQEVVLAVKE